MLCSQQRLCSIQTEHQSGNTRSEHYRPNAPDQHSQQPIEQQQDMHFSQALTEHFLQ